MNSSRFFPQATRLCYVLIITCLLSSNLGSPIVARAQNMPTEKQQPVELQKGKCDSATPGKSKKCEQQAQMLQSALVSSVSVFGSPLDFYAYADTSTAMYYNGYQQFFGGNAEGVFIWVNGYVYGPGYVPAGQTTYSYTPISNSLTGVGISGNPWIATTVVDVGNTGLRIQQAIRYVNGEAYVTYSWRVTNTTSNPISYTLFHAADLYTDDDDYGYGYYNASTRAIGGYNAYFTFYQYFQPITPVSHYFEGYYADTWARIGSLSGQGNGFNDTYRPYEYIDNSAGLQWNRSLPAHSADLISDYGVFNTQAGGITCYSLGITYDPSMGNVTAYPPENCPNGSGYTNNTTVTLKAFPANGYKFSRWDGDTSDTSDTVNVVIRGNKAVNASFMSMQQKPVIVLVHGWWGLPPFISQSVDTCRLSQGNYLTPYHITNENDLPSFYDFGGFAKNLLDDGWDIWVAHVETGPAGTGTPRIQYNADCLQHQLAYVRAQTNVTKVTLIAHSMGGLVSRAYIEDDSLYNEDVSQLITLGTPHSGTPYGEGFCLNNLILPDSKEDKAACQFSLGTAGHIGEFNNSYSPREPDVIYDFIGGNKTPFGIAAPVLRYLGTEGPNDGVVGAQSGIGRMYWPLSNPTDFVDIGSGGSRHIISTSHSGIKFATFPWPEFSWQKPYISWQTYSVGLRQWFPSFFNLDLEDQVSRTESYQCVLNLLDVRTENHKNDPRGYCPPQTTTLVQPFNTQSQDTSVVSETPMISEHISIGQEVTHLVPIDTTGFSDFTLVWDSGVLGFTLINPLGSVIDSDYVASHPEEVVYEENINSASPLFKRYHFISPVSGQYTLHIVATDVGVDGTNYAITTLFESERTLAISSDSDLYSIGSIATLTATLKRIDIGLAGATVQAFIYRPGSGTDTVNLTDQGEGIYQGTYIIPNAPGYLGFGVIANGVDNGTPYSRQVDSLIAVSSSAALLTGNYSDYPIDDDNNGKYEAIAVNVGLYATQAGDYLVSGDLVSGNSLVAHYAGTFTFANTGFNTATLLFNGDDIRRSALNGPYTLTNLTVSDQQNAGLPTVWQAMNLWVTSPYNFQDLAATCFVLTVATNLPSSGTINLNPAPNCNNGLQYTSDSEVSVSVIANPGYHFTGWGGDASGATSMVSVKVDADKSVTANLASNNEGILILGNAGISGATLSYTDGTPKTVITDATGSYAIVVSSGWSGMITPSLAGAIFTPANKSYNNVTTNQTDQNYTAQRQFSSFGRWTTSFDLSHGWTVAQYVRTVGDVNGDGKADLVGFGLDGVYVALSNGSGFSIVSKWTSAFDLSHGWTVSQYVRTVGDVNGDGKADLVGFGLDGVYVALSNGSGFSPVSKWTSAFDLSHGWTVASFVRTVGDLNGDGKADLIGFGLDGVYVALSNGYSFDPVYKWTSAFDLAHGWTVSQYVRTVGDVNGDGKADLIGFGLDGVYVALSNGSGFEAVNKWTSAFDLSHGWTVSQYVRTVGDVNGDGKADLIGFGLDGVYVALSTGSDFTPISRWTPAFDLSHDWTVNQYVRTVGDVSGDGLADLIGFGLDGVYVAK